MAVTAEGGIPAVARYSRTPVINSGRCGSDSSTTTATRSSGVTARRKDSNRIGRSSASTTAERTSPPTVGAVLGSGMRSASRTASDQRDRPTGTSIADIHGLRAGLRSVGYMAIVRLQVAEGNRALVAVEDQCRDR